MTPAAIDKSTRYRSSTFSTNESWNNGLNNFQKDTSCLRLECCRHLHKLCLHNFCLHRWGPDSVFWQAGRRSLPHGWLCSSQKRGTSSKILAPRHTQTNTLQSYGFVTYVSCNHTHWVHPKCTHIKQRQYKHDWRCTIHTPIQIVTTTPSTDNTTNHHKQITTHPLTNNINQRT